MDDQYHTLSLRLYETLDWIGASEEMRGKYRELSILSEITTRMVLHFMDERGTVYQLGSIGDGTTTTGLESDLDLLACYGDYAVENLSDAPPHGLSYLIVTDDTTKPGYVKLQEVINKVPVYHPDTFTENDCVPDQYGRMCLQHIHRLTDEYRDINGPAVTSTGIDGLKNTDAVNALSCQHIPSFASSWVTRVTSCNRLNETQINMLKELGCLFVGKNHPSSQNGPIEWRMSFSLQERELMTSLNPTQYKCFILLKMINKDIIHRIVSTEKSISSYHCKTVLLYAVEVTACEFWTRRNLLECALLCIKLLLHWVREQNCPNYFIPNENMFDRIDQRTLRQVQCVLEDMVEHWCSFLWSITCDDVGKVMSNLLFISGPSIMNIKHEDISLQVLCLHVNIMRSLRIQTLICLKHCNAIPASNYIVKLQSIETSILQTDCVRNHTEKETRQAIRYFLPHLRLQIAQGIASFMLTTTDSNRLSILFGLFKYYIEESRNVDTISRYLIEASYCLQSDRYEICEKILLQCETSLKSPVVSVCGCNKYMQLFRNETVVELVRMLRSQEIPYTEFARTCATGCLVFLPHQCNILPPALRYEMYRSVCTSPDSRDGSRYFPLDWIVVDSKVFLYFLQYVLYSKTNKPVCKLKAVDNLTNVINTDIHLGHKETAWSLIGWIFKQEHNIQGAMECFRTSLRIQPVHNAAKWHLLEMIRSINTLNSDRHMR